MVFANRVAETNERLRVENLYPDQLEIGGRWAKWESHSTYAARMRRFSSVKEKSEWNGETLEREVMISTSSAAATKRGREKRLKITEASAKGRLLMAPQKENLVSGTKSPVPKRVEAVEPGLLALKIRGLDLDEDIGNGD